MDESVGLIDENGDVEPMDEDIELIEEDVEPMDEDIEPMDDDAQRTYQDLIWVSNADLPAV